MKIMVTKKYIFYAQVGDVFRYGNDQDARNQYLCIGWFMSQDGGSAEGASAAPNPVVEYVFVRLHSYLGAKSMGEFIEIANKLDCILYTVP